MITVFNRSGKLDALVIVTRLYTDILLVMEVWGTATTFDYHYIYFLIIAHNCIIDAIITYNLLMLYNVHTYTTHQQ